MAGPHESTEERSPPVGIPSRILALHPETTRMCVPPRGRLSGCRFIELFVLTVSAGWEARPNMLSTELILNMLNPPNAGAGVR